VILSRESVRTNCRVWSCGRLLPDFNRYSTFSNPQTLFAKDHPLKSLNKSLCKLKKDQLAEVLPVLAAEVAESRFICRRCGRMAKAKKWLCKPESIEKISRGYQPDSSALGLDCGD